MGRIYFLRWNTWQGAPARVTTHTPSKRTGGLLRHLALALAFPACALALPDGGQISAGSGNIGQNGTTLTVTQTSPKLAINWQGFNIGQSETVHFNQPGSSAIALNRVLGQAPSQILGNLRANGQVFVLNPNGVLFGSTAQVNVGGLVASSLSLNDADFLAGSYTFRTSGAAGSVVNQGALTAANSGYLALLAPEARNEGVISATLGTALLAAGDTVTLHLHNGSLLSYTIDHGTLNALAENKHLIRADGGQVILSAQAAGLLTRSVVNNTGIIEAHTIQNQGGVITLLGDMQGGQVNVSGTLDASGRNTGETGGTVKVLGDHVALFDSARLDVSGASGGGTALVGGNFQGKGPEPNASVTFFAPGAQLNGDALTNGNGGKVILWADDTMRAFGSISARGGTQGGNGGFVEVSGKRSLIFAANVDRLAPKGSAGTLLLDPTNLTIVAGSSSNNVTAGPTFEPAFGSGSTLGWTEINSALAGGDVIVQTTGGFDAGEAGDITITGAGTLTNGNALSIITYADPFNPGNIVQDSGATITRNAAGALNLTSAGSVTLNDSITLNNSALTVTARSLSQAAGTINAGGLVTIDVSDTTGGGSQSSGAVIAGTGGLTKTGAGRFTLNGANSYAGNTALNAGRLFVGNNNALGSGTLLLNGGSLAASGGARTLANPVIVNANSTFADSLALTLNGAVTLSGDRTLTVTNTTTLNAALGESGGARSLTKAGAGNLVLNATSTYTGTTAITAGTLALGALGTISPANLTLNGGVLATQGNFSRAFGSGPNQMQFGTNGGGFAAYGGALTIDGFAGTPIWGTTTGFFSANATAHLIFGSSIADNVVTWTNPFSLGASGHTIVVNDNTGSASDLAVISGVISADAGGALAKEGTGTLTLSGNNTYTGVTTINRGTLRLAGDAAIVDSGAVSLANVAGVTLDLNNSNETIGSLSGGGTTGGIVTNSGAATSTLTTGDGTNTAFAGVIENGIGTVALVKQGSGVFTLAGANTYSGTTTVTAGTLTGTTTSLQGAIADNATLVFDQAGSGTYAGVISGSGNVTKLGAGNVTLSGANTYAGATTINAGKLVAANVAALGSTAGSTTVADAATLEIANVAVGSETVTLNGTGVGGAGALTGIGTASLSGPVTLATASALGATAGNTLTLSGTIEGSGALDVLGGGTVTLGGTIGSSTALASLNGASGTTLAINGGLVRTSGTQTYGGATTFGGATILRTTAGGSVSAPGAVTATAGTLTLNTGAGDATFANVNNNFGTVAATSTNNVSLVDSNALSIGPINATGLVDIRTQTGDLTLNSAIATTSTSANAVTLVADAAATPDATGSGDNFKNPGSAAITTGPGGAWRIYTGNPTNTSRGGLAEAGKRYNVDDGSDPLASGNRLYFRIQPTLTLTAENKTKTYGDANPAFTYSSAGLIDGDPLAAAISSGPSYTVDGTTSTSGQLTAGTLHNITPSAATATSLGYSLAYANGALTVNQKALTISATGVNKVYDGGLGAIVTYADNRVAGDLLTIGGTAAYLDKNVGPGKTVNVSDITLTNTDAGNYTFNTTAATIADITRANLAVAGVTAANKVYDGTTTATLGGAATVTALGGDAVSLGGSGSGVFTDKNVALDKTVIVSGYSISGADADNYSLLQPTGVTADITARPLTVTATGVAKVYDGTTAAIVTYADNRVAGDLLSISGIAAYLDKNVGTGKSVNVNNIALDNADAGNYTVNPTAATTADIIARALTIAANDATKYYTGIPFMGGNGVTYAGFANGETYAVLDGTLAYGGTSQGAVNPGSYLITPSGLTAGNYSITYTDGMLTVRPAPAAGETLPTVAEAVVALPGDGANLLTAFNAAKTAAITPPATPVLVPSGILDFSKPQSTGVSIENNHTVEQVGSLTLVNGGVKLPTDTNNSDEEDEEKKKSDAKTSGE